MGRTAKCRLAASLIVAPAAAVLCAQATGSIVPVGNPATFNFTNFHYTYTHLTDFDQVRGSLGVLPLCVNPAPPPAQTLCNCQAVYVSSNACNSNAGALRACGVMYCGPTSGVNLLTYAAHHGYPDVLNNNGFTKPAGFNPDHTNWNAWAGTQVGQPHYDAVTHNIKRMATLMGKPDTAGAACNGVWPLPSFKGIKAAFRNSGLVVGGAGSYGPYAPNFAYSGLAVSRGWVMILAYNRYAVINPNFNGYMVLGALNAGHVVTLSGVQRRPSENFYRFTIHDPGDDFVPNGDHMTTQSQFQPKQALARNRWVIIVGEPFQPPHWRYVSEIYNIGENHVTLLNWVIGIRPKQGWAVLPGGGLGGGSTLVLLNPTEWGGLPPEEHFPSPSGTAILDAMNHPDTDAVALLTEGENDSPAQVWMLHPLTGEAALVAEIPGGTRMRVGRDRMIYVLAGDRLHRIDPSSPEEAMPDVPPPGGGMGDAGPDEIELPASAEALAYDDATDDLLLLSASTGQVIRVTANDFTREPGVQALPKGVSAGSGGSIDVHPDDGTIWALIHGSSALYELSKNQDGDLELVQAHNIKGVQSPTSLQFDDDGGLWVTDGGKAIELRLDEKSGEWLVFEDSEFKDFEVGSFFGISRSRSNLVEGVHDDERVEHIPPDELDVGYPAPLCFADLNDDGIVDADDLLILLAAWGVLDFSSSPLPDLNNDFRVNVRDLLLMLGAWGRCPAAE